MKPTILLVEDNLDAIPFAISAISEKFSVYPDKNTLIIANDYDGALEALDTHPEINIVITDLFFAKKTGSDDISLGLELLDAARVAVDKSSSNSFRIYQRTISYIELSRQTIQEKPSYQGLGYFVAKKAQDMGKYAFVVSSIYHHDNFFQALLDLFRGIHYFDGLSIINKLEYPFIWKIIQSYSKDKKQLTKEELEDLYQKARGMVSDVLKTQLIFWELAMDNLSELILES